jgi:hypothetical protein
MRPLPRGVPIEWELLGANAQGRVHAPARAYLERK